MRKKALILFVAIMTGMMSLSCTKFLQEEPKTFLASDNYYTSEQQLESAANGLYGGLGLMEERGIVANTQPLFLIEALAGYAERTYLNSNEVNQGYYLNVAEDNYICEQIWDKMYVYIENCNSFIQGVENATAEISAQKRDLYLAEGYFFRAWYYYTLVRCFGPIPLKTTPTTSLENAKMPLTDEKTVFETIVSDLETAEHLSEAGNWTDGAGRIRKGAIKSLLASVYLTMAGYPVNDQSYYSKAYAKALEVFNGGAYYLYETYESARDHFKTVDGGEYILTNQHCYNVNESGTHHSFCYYNPAEPLISASCTQGGGNVPSAAFYASYPESDLRVAEQGYHFTHYPAVDGSGEVVFDRPCVFKYWDKNAVSSGKSDANFPLIRYTDVLLTLAEAACAGGSTSDAMAIEAYWQVHSRALPSAAKPASLSFEDVFKERFWEECYEGHLWFDMLRTRKAFDFPSGKVTNLVGYTAPTHSRAFAEKDFLLPYPSSEVRLNPNLKR